MHLKSEHESLLFLKNALGTPPGYPSHFHFKAMPCLLGKGGDAYNPRLITMIKERSRLTLLLKSVHVASSFTEENPTSTFGGG
ncbi:hypothetical protein ACQP3J_31050, partial [Escherichia coli]